MKDQRFLTDSKLRFYISGFGFRTSGFVFRVPGSGFRVPGFGFRVPGFGFRVPDFGFRVPGLRKQGCGPARCFFFLLFFITLGPGVEWHNNL